MRKPLLLFDEKELDRLHAAVLQVLQRVGMKVCHEAYFTPALASGALVDPFTSSVKFPEPLVNAFLDERLAHPISFECTDDLTGPYPIGLSGVIAPFFHDYPARARRPATREDLLNTIHWADVDLDPRKTVDLAVTMSDVDPAIEPIEAYGLLLQNSSRPDRAYCTSSRQIPALIELSKVYFGKAIFPRGTDFVTSPLTFSHRLGEHTHQAILFGQRKFGIGVMPISGGNSPVTIAGNIVVAAAEALGAALLIRAIAPDAVFTFHACNGSVDMRKGSALFNAPEALLSDLGFTELVNRRYGGGGGVAAGSDYIDAALPGMQAVYERVQRSMAISAYTGAPFALGGQGTLDAGQIFSPVQFILERDMAEGLWQFGRGIEVSDETIAIDSILQIGSGEGRSYIEMEHTLRHCHDQWRPRLMYRGEYESDEAEHGRDQQMMDAAYARYTAAIQRFTPPSIDPAVRCAIESILKAVHEGKL
jgi:trimethylamine---corrinoid protein Co-methyltransferase